MTMKKILLSIVFVFVFAYLGKAQSRHIYTQYFVNPVLINPGATGYNGGQNLLLNYRNTWATFPGSPKTFSFSYDGMVTEKVGLGAFVMSDTYGSLQTTKGQLSYSYNLRGKDYNLGIGFTTEYSKYNLTGGGFGSDANDPKIVERRDGDKFFEVAVGAHGVFQDRFIISAAFPGLVRSKINADENDVKEEKQFNYIFGLGYIYKIPEYQMGIYPSVYVRKLRNINTLIDANLLLTFYDGMLSGGATYGFGYDKRLGFIIGAKLNKLSFNYSYDFSFRGFQAYNNGSHEFTVGYHFNR